MHVSRGLVAIIRAWDSIALCYELVTFQTHWWVEAKPDHLVNLRVHVHRSVFSFLFWKRIKGLLCKLPAGSSSTFRFFFSYFLQNKKVKETKS